MLENKFTPDAEWHNRVRAAERELFTKGRVAVPSDNGRLITNNTNWKDGERYYSFTATHSLVEGDEGHRYSTLVAYEPINEGNVKEDDRFTFVKEITMTGEIIAYAPPLLEQYNYILEPDSVISNLKNGQKEQWERVQRTKDSQREMGYTLPDVFTYSALLEILEKGSNAVT